MLSTPGNFSDKIKAELMDVLVGRFNVRGAHLVNQALLALYSYNATTGVVVDVGERLEIVPVTDGESRGSVCVCGGGGLRSAMGAFVKIHAKWWEWDGTEDPGKIRRTKGFSGENSQQPQAPCSVAEQHSGTSRPVQRHFVYLLPLDNQRGFRQKGRPVNCRAFCDNRDTAHHVSLANHHVTLVLALMRRSAKRRCITPLLFFIPLLGSTLNFDADVINNDRASPM